MKPSEAQPTEIVDFRAERYLPDGNIVVSFATKQSGERQSYTLPVASLYSFIADLQKLQAASRPVQDAPAAAAPPVQPPAPSPPPPAGTSNRIEVTVPRKWMAKGLPDRNMVLMIFDPQSEKQAAYALPQGAAREMAAGLVKEAENLAKAASDKAALGRSATG